MVWAPPFSLATTGGINYCSLFLRLLRCFSSARTPSDTMNSCQNNHKDWVIPFGDLWIKASWQLPKDYRGLVRPSSVLSTKAFTVCIIVEYFLAITAISLQLSAVRLSCDCLMTDDFLLMAFIGLHTKLAISFQTSAVRLSYDCLMTDDFLLMTNYFVVFTFQSAKPPKRCLVMSN